MEVIQQDTHLTHAVLGARPEETIQATMEVTPHLFQMFSSGLYSNQRLAVVREVMCNGWDGHISIGNKQPIEINYNRTSGVLSFKDHGPGLSFEDMKKYYITYNSSSKRESTNQTGGFGIGCKAPFAYVDSFGVDSYHGGTKSVYLLTKRGEDGSYIPTMQRVVTVETDRTGVTVNIQLRQGEWGTFKELIEQVAYKGEIPTLLSQDEDEPVLLPMLNMNHKTGFVIASNCYDISEINVRIGNVVYPIKRKTTGDAKFIEAYDALQHCFRRASGRIVIMAPGGTVSMTPNREELSMVPTTVTNLIALMNAARTQLTEPLNPVAATNYINRASRMVAKAFAHAVGTSTMLKLPSSFDSLYNFFPNLQVCYSTVEDRQWINAFQRLNYKLILKLVFNHIRKTHPQHSGELRKLLNYAEKKAVMLWGTEFDRSLQKRIQKINKAQVIFHRYNASKFSALLAHMVAEMKPPRFASRGFDNEQGVDFLVRLANLVIAEPYITSKQTKIWDSLEEVKLNPNASRIVIHMPRTAKWDERVAEIKQIFPTAVEAYYEEPIKAARKYKATDNGNTMNVIKSHGYALLQDCISVNGKVLEKYPAFSGVIRPNVDKTKRVKNPDCILNLTDNDHVTLDTDRNFISILMHLMKESKSHIGVVTSNTQVAYAKEQGLPFFAEYLKDLVTGLDRTIKYIAYTSVPLGNVIDRLPKEYVWKNLFGGSDAVPEQGTLDLLKYFLNRGDYHFSYNIRGSMEHVRAVYKKYASEAEEIVEHLVNENHLRLFNEQSLPPSTAIWLYENFITKEFK